MKRTGETWLLIALMPVMFVAILTLALLIGRFFYIAIPVLLIWDYITTKKYGRSL